MSGTVSQLAPRSSDFFRIPELYGIPDNFEEQLLHLFLKTEALWHAFYPLLVLIDFAQLVCIDRFTRNQISLLWKDEKLIGKIFKHRLIDIKTPAFTAFLERVTYNPFLLRGFLAALPAEQTNEVLDLTLESLPNLKTIIAVLNSKYGDSVSEKVLNDLAKKSIALIQDISGARELLYSRLFARMPEKKLNSLFLLLCYCGSQLCDEVQFALESQQVHKISAETLGCSLIYTDDACIVEIILRSLYASAISAKALGKALICRRPRGFWASLFAGIQKDRFSRLRDPSYATAILNSKYAAKISAGDLGKALVYAPNTSYVITILSSEFANKISPEDFERALVNTTDASIAQAILGSKSTSKILPEGFGKALNNLKEDSVAQIILNFELVKMRETVSHNPLHLILKTQKAWDFFYPCFRSEEIGAIVLVDKRTSLWVNLMIKSFIAFLSIEELDILWNNELFKCRCAFTKAILSSSRWPMIGRNLNQEFLRVLPKSSDASIVNVLAILNSESGRTVSQETLGILIETGWEFLFASGFKEILECSQASRIPADSLNKVLVESAYLDSQKVFWESEILLKIEAILKSSQAYKIYEKNLGIILAKFWNSIDLEAYPCLHKTDNLLGKALYFALHTLCSEQTDTSVTIKDILDFSQARKISVEDLYEILLVSGRQRNYCALRTVLNSKCMDRISEEKLNNIFLRWYEDAIKTEILLYSRQAERISGKALATALERTYSPATVRVILSSPWKDKLSKENIEVGATGKVLKKAAREHSAGAIQYALGALAPDQLSEALLLLTFVEIRFILSYCSNSQLCQVLRLGLFPPQLKLILLIILHFSWRLFWSVFEWVCRAKLGSEVNKQ